MTPTEKRVLAAARRFADLADKYRRHAGSMNLAVRTDAAEMALIKSVAADAAARRKKK